MPWIRSPWETRAATLEELAMLQSDLAKDKLNWEQIDLSKSIVYVTTFKGKIVMFGAARLIWQIEPIKWLEGEREQFKPAERRKATFLTFSKLRGWLEDPRHNPLVRSYFALVSNANRAMQAIAEKKRTSRSVGFQLTRLYRNVKFYGEDFEGVPDGWRTKQFRAGDDRGKQCERVLAAESQPLQ